MDRFDDRLSSIQDLLADTVALNKKLIYLGNHASLKNAQEVVNFAKDLSFQFNGLSNFISQDLRGNWITLEEYNILKRDLENVKSILSMLGVEV